MCASIISSFKSDLINNMDHMRMENTPLNCKKSEKT